MPVPTLLISNPPHGAVDARILGRVLDLLPAEAALKAGYQIPEIWLAAGDREHAEAAAAELGGAGCRVTAAPAEDLGSLPAQEPIEGVSFTDAGLVVELVEGDVLLGYDRPLVVVVCTPRLATGAPLTGGPPDGTGAWGTFVDLYAAPEGTLRRLGALGTVTDFTNLDGAAAIGAAARMLRFVALCEARFPRAAVDRRLMHLQIRSRHSAQASTRKGYAFAMPALDRLLEAISTTLEEISHCELGSRLVFLTRQWVV